MSLLLTGAKTLTIAGTEMSAVELYTGESYTIPIEFTDGTGNAINTGGWTIGATAKFYNCDVTYTNADIVNIANLSLDSPQPNTGAGTYAANLEAAWSNTSAGQGYLYIPTDMTGNVNGDNTPIVPLEQTGANTVLVIVTIEVTLTDRISTFFYSILFRFCFM